jgi:outer membrane exchange protein TraA
MQHRLILPLLCCFAGFAQNAQAAPVPPIDKSQRAAPPRTDVGTGICGNITHFAQPQTPLTQKSDAEMILNLPMGNSMILGRTARIFDNINFRNSQPGSNGDFQPPNYRKDFFPYSSDPSAMPTGDDNNIALRLRGYFNVPATLTGKVIDFGLNCDDFCSLTVGTTPVIPVADERISARVIRQVTFKDPGLYPVELVYYQNGSTAYLEWSHTTTAIPECPNDICGTSLTAPSYNMAFVPMAREELYSSIVGSNPGCQECGAAGMPPCSTGNYCGDGLCQSCVTPDHCGATCITCPQNRYICSAGQCVQCTADDQCPNGQTCNIGTGTCTPPMACSTGNDCPKGQVCDADMHVCVNPPMTCATNDPGMCPAGQMCDLVHHICKTPPKMCNTDADCPDNYYCDTAEHICKVRLTEIYVGGQAGCSMGSGHGQGAAGAAAGMMALFGLALLGLVARGRRRLALAVAAGDRVSLRNRSALRRAAFLLPVFFCAVATEAHAQTNAISINAQTFRPAIGPENIFTVEGTRTPGRWVPMANVLFEWAYRPLRLLNSANNMTVADTVPNMVTLHLMGGIGITRWFSVGLDLPVVVYQGFDPNTPASDAMAPASAGIADLRLVTKFRIINNNDGGFGLAFVPQFTAPTGKGTEFRGDDTFGIEPRVAVDYKTKSGFIVALNASVLLRFQDQLARNVRVSHQVRYGLGAFLPLPAGFGLAGEVEGGTSFFNADTIYTPLEAYLGVRWIHQTGININLGGGPGLTPVAGSPQFRLFASVGYLPMGPRKKEPVKPHVVDLDPDRDGLIGDNDRCTTVWGPPENQGCPDVDTDKDGIIDREDKCPLEPGPKENHGCPDKDRDNDGLVDRLDSCPDEPGPLENNGCPLLDTDKDGIPDKDDKCPYEPGPKENNGCPPPRKYINVTQEKIELLQKIQFATNKATINPGPSFELLDEVVSVLKSRPTMRVHIEGHTDSRGTLKWNMELSKMRAEAVRNYLVNKGVEGERLTFEGYGPTRPIGDNKTKAGQDKNRRTEFVIVQQ